MNNYIYNKIVEKTLRIPASDLVPFDSSITTDGSVVARQLDVALMHLGFKMSGELLSYITKYDRITALEESDKIIEAVKVIIGDDTKYNTYFKDFPENIPDTAQFWMECIIDVLGKEAARDKVIQGIMIGRVNLLDLPKYGKYEHTYENMLDAHEKFIPTIKDRITILNIGKSIHEEALSAFNSLVMSNVPLSIGDRELLEILSSTFEVGPGAKIPLRENLAIVNKSRMEKGLSIVADTTTDVLRLICALSQGDITLATPTKFKSFPRAKRRVIMGSLNKVAGNPGKIEDVLKYKEVWKRVASSLHPGEYRHLVYANNVFAAARGDLKSLSTMGKVEKAISDGRVDSAITILGTKPGMFIRSLDRIIRLDSEDNTDLILGTLEKTVPETSGRVLLSLREHLINRQGYDVGKRIFVNRKGNTWVIDGNRVGLRIGMVNDICWVIDKEIKRRLPVIPYLVLDKSLDDVQLALPLSSKSLGSGFNVVPRGSVTKHSGELLRFFIHWKETRERTDYDLSALLLDYNFVPQGQVSFTNLRSDRNNNLVMYHSGDITESDFPEGSTEFIDVVTSEVPEGWYVVPQINMYAGKGYDQVQELYFGYMVTSKDQFGKPYEPSTVRYRSDIRTPGNVSLPLHFKITPGYQEAKWQHMSLKGYDRGNSTESNKLCSSIVVKSVADREYLQVKYITSILNSKSGARYTIANPDISTIPVTYIGIEAPTIKLHQDSKIITIQNLHELIPD